MVKPAINRLLFRKLKHLKHLEHFLSLNFNKKVQPNQELHFIPLPQINGHFLAALTLAHLDLAPGISVQGAQQLHGGDQF